MQRNRLLDRFEAVVALPFDETVVLYVARDAGAVRQTRSGARIPTLAHVACVRVRSPRGTSVASSGVSSCWVVGVDVAPISSSEMAL